MSYQPQFPMQVQSLASTVYADLAVGAQHAASAGFSVQVNSEPLHAPQRVYFDPARLKTRIEISAGAEHALTLCFGSRHCNGPIREVCLSKMLGLNETWVAPFVVQLLGEYVVEIVQLIHAGVPLLHPGIYGQFVRENPGFIATTQRRAISYWDCYHRHAFPQLAAYPGMLALRALEKMGGENCGPQSRTFS